jgi:membrane-associated phospholipid phosphatase
MDGYKRDFRITDWLFYNYNATVVILLILRGHHVEYRWLFCLSNILLIVFINVIVNRWRFKPELKLRTLLRDWYPYLFFFYLHWESGMIGDLLFVGTFDPMVEQWGHSIVGSSLHKILYNYQPLWFAEFVHFSYFFYYILIILPAYFLYKDDNPQFHNFIFDISLLFLIHYTIFYMFPVVGPIEQHLTKFPDGLFFIPIMKFIYHIGDSPGGAMPSSHVTVSIMAWYWLYLIRPKLAWPLLFLTISLIFATVYLSYHYAIDSIVGVIFGIIFLYTMEFLRNKYGDRAFV